MIISQERQGERIKCDSREIKLNTTLCSGWLEPETKLVQTKIIYIFSYITKTKRKIEKMPKIFKELYKSTRKKIMSKNLQREQ